MKSINRALTSSPPSVNAQTPQGEELQEILVSCEINSLFKKQKLYIVLA